MGRSHDFIPTLNFHPPFPSAPVSSPLQQPFNRARLFTSTPQPLTFEFSVFLAPPKAIVKQISNQERQLAFFPEIIRLQKKLHKI
ncbi:hypothetical protein B0O99DRAFT_47576 [Bisporella sp. PMI_857]|nr:hypothetical protein B0O99DRAFT_47576 [Bisporella sp. PMI_857]